MVFMSPLLKDDFHFGVYEKDKLFTSAPLRLVLNESDKLLSDHPGKIPSTGSVNIIINMKTEEDKICIFLLKSEIFEGIRLMTAFPLFGITNNIMEYDLHLSCAASDPTKVINSFKTVEVIKRKNRNFAHPLLFWEANSLTECQELYDSSFCAKFFLSCCLCNSVQHMWSRPVDLCFETAVDRRCSIAVPGSSEGSLPVVMTIHKRHECIFLTVSVDTCPLLLIHNQTNMLLFCGEEFSECESKTVKEEEKKYLPPPSVFPGCSCYYMPQSMENQFPVPRENFPKIFLGVQDENDSFAYIWSTPVNINVDNQFVNIHGICYLKISKERFNRTVNLFINVVNRIELTAKEVRSRIAVETNTVECDKIKNKYDPSSYLPSEISVCNDFCKYTEPTIYPNRIQNGSYSIYKMPFSLYAVIRASNISLTICDESKNFYKMSEILRINISEVLLFSRTNTIYSAYTHLSHQMQEISISFMHIQVDNQIDQDEKTIYDFPVILKQHHDLGTISDCKAEKNILFINKVREKAFLVIDLALETTLFKRGLCTLQKVNISMQPASLYLEDSLYYKVINLYKSYVPTEFCSCYSLRHQGFYVPTDVNISSVSFSHPLHIQYMKIDIKEIYLSIHASLKLYLSLDSSLLRFQPFEKEDMFTNCYEFGRMLVVHYLTGALFRAGWVVGSLDLLGNPAGFVRAIGTGMSDFFLLPYRGLLNGPRAFIIGFSDGAAALFTQISSGAVTCVANLAASISRNMDRLSLDADHLARQELLRRHLPTGITGGLLQGLSGFGISLLGAIAGIVDHPLQVLISPSTPLNTATGIIGGFAKGLVGVITKPIGGAAVLVSQTGYGLLHGAGWRNQPFRHYQPVDTFMNQFPNSLLKLSYKLSQSNILGEVLFFAEAKRVNNNENCEECVLLLTSEVLCIINTEDDNQQQAFSLIEIKCSASDQNPTVLITYNDRRKKELCQETDHVKNRVAEYVQKNWFYNSDDPLTSNDDAVSSSTFIFSFHTEYRNCFIALFHAAKKKLLCRGFSV